MDEIPLNSQIHTLLPRIFFILSKEKYLTISVTTYFSSLHSSVIIYLSLFLPFCIWRLKYINWGCKWVSTCNWLVYKLSFGHCILLAWQIFFPPLNQHSINTYLNNSRNIISACSLFLSEWNWQRNNPLLRVFSLSPLFLPLLKGLWTSASLVFLNKSLKNINSSCRL